MKALALLLLVACNSRVDNSSSSAVHTCTDDSQCTEKDSSCFVAMCRPRGGDGAVCLRRSDCREGFECQAGRCMSSAAALALETAAKQAEKAAEDEKTRDLLKQSGVETPAEAPVPEAPATGSGSASTGAIRVVETSSMYTAFAACKPTERLVGGGCKANASVNGSYPSGGSPGDTIGARWNCEAGGKVDAYALCALR